MVCFEIGFSCVWKYVLHTSPLGHSQDAKYNPYIKRDELSVCVQALSPLNLTLHPQHGYPVVADSAVMFSTVEMFRTMNKAVAAASKAKRQIRN